MPAAVPILLQKHPHLLPLQLLQQQLLLLLLCQMQQQMRSSRLLLLLVTLQRLLLVLLLELHPQADPLLHSEPASSFSYAVVPHRSTA
jgi:hypothetical protein